MTGDVVRPAVRGDPDRSDCELRTNRLLFETVKKVTALAPMDFTRRKALRHGA